MNLIGETWYFVILVAPCGHSALEGKSHVLLSSVRLKVEQDQLVNQVGLFGLGLVELQGA